MALTFTPSGADSDATEFASLIAQLQSTSPAKRAGGKLCVAAGVSGKLAPISGGFTAPVMIEGEGPASVLVFTDPGVPASSTIPGQRNYALNLNQPGTAIRDLAIRSAAELELSQATLFQEPAQGCGIRQQDTTLLENVSISGFWAGHVKEGNHSTSRNVHAQNNYVNCYYGPNAATFGNNSHSDDIYTNAFYASIAIHPRNFLDTVYWDNVHAGWAPHGLVLMAQIPGQGDMHQTAINNVSRFDVEFEQCGYDFIVDLGFGTAQGRSIVNSVLTRAWSGSLNPEFRNPGDPPSAYTVSVDTVSGLTVDTPGELTQPGTEGVWQFAHASGVVGISGWAA